MPCSPQQRACGARCDAAPADRACCCSPPTRAWLWALCCCAWSPWPRRATTRRPAQEGFVMGCWEQRIWQQQQQPPPPPPKGSATAAARRRMPSFGMACEHSACACTPWPCRPLAKCNCRTPACPAAPRRGLLAWPAARAWTRFGIRQGVTKGFTTRANTCGGYTARCQVDSAGDASMGMPICPLRDESGWGSMAPAHTVQPIDNFADYPPAGPTFIITWACVQPSGTPQGVQDPPWQQQALLLAPGATGCVTQPLCGADARQTRLYSWSSTLYVDLPRL